MSLCYHKRWVRSRVSVSCIKERRVLEHQSLSKSEIQQGETDIKKDSYGFKNGLVQGAREGLKEGLLRPTRAGEEVFLWADRQST